MVRRPSPGDSQRSGCAWDFNQALDILNIPDRARPQCERELLLIGALYHETRLIEAQLTPARKKETFQRAGRWYRRRQPVVDKMQRLLNNGLTKEARLLFLEVVRMSWLPQSLEWEAVRLQSEGLSPEESFRTLRDRYERQSRGGGNESDALRNAVQRLQTFAGQKNKNLIWRNRNIPPDLIPFIIAALEAAEITHYPDFFGGNPSKFRRLMIKPVKATKAKARINSFEEFQALEEFVTAKSWPSEKTELERRLSKVFL
jgi:hypothetical protein